MNVGYINPFIKASVNVFKTFAMLESIPGAPDVSVSLKQSGYVNGFIGLEGHGISGYFVINFSHIFLQQIFRNLFGPRKISTNEELFDAAGELTNMISGGAKAELSQQGFFFDVAVPRITQSVPAIPEHLKTTPVIIVPFDTEAGNYTIQASILKIDEDFITDSTPEIPPPGGMISVNRFSELTGMGPIKVRRFLKTGFLTGKKVSRTQWHIPETELAKIQIKKSSKKNSPGNGVIDEACISITEFSRLAGLPQAKIKGFLRTGFIKGSRDENNVWFIKRSYASKFRKY